MDSEIKAMGDVATALDSLDPEVAGRVLRWANERYRIKIKTPSASSGGTSDAGAGAEHPATTQQFTDFHELFDAANPTSGPDKALVAAYWFQVAQGNEDLESFQLNTELKNLGHPSTNITRDLDGLIHRTPRYIMQTRKEGTSRQARKKYKITREGIRAVERMLGRASAAE